jgi:hypothetical protein
VPSDARATWHYPNVGSALYELRPARRCGTPTTSATRSSRSPDSGPGESPVPRSAQRTRGRLRCRLARQFATVPEDRSGPVVARCRFAKAACAIKCAVRATGTMTEGNTSRGSASRTISGSMPDDAKSRSTTGWSSERSAGRRRTVERRPTACCSSTVSGCVQACNQRFRFGVVGHSDRQVGVACEPGLRAHRHGEPADQRKSDASLGEISRNPRQCVGERGHRQRVSDDARGQQGGRPHRHPARPGDWSATPAATGRFLIRRRPDAHDADSAASAPHRHRADAASREGARPRLGSRPQSNAGWCLVVGRPKRCADTETRFPVTREPTRRFLIPVRVERYLASA